MIRLTAYCIFCFLMVFQCSALPVEEHIRYCTEHLQCGPMKICDPIRQYCRFVHTMDELLLRIPCRPVFKSPCKVNSDCTCTTHLLVCEDNECVLGR